MTASANTKWNDKDEYDKTQLELMKEVIILVDQKDNHVGSISKKGGHLRSYIDKEDAFPHRAFSVFLFNDKNELLLQKRSDVKITFPNMWTNTWCSHPLYIPSELEEKGNILYSGIKRAAVRRLKYELNLDGIDETDFSMISKILYKADTDKTWAEFEMDYILFIKKNSDQIAFTPNHNEISETKFVSKNEIIDFLESEISDGKGNITPWFNLILQTKLFSWWKTIEEIGNVPEEDSKGHIVNFLEEDKGIKLAPLSEIKKSQ